MELINLAWLLGGLIVGAFISGKLARLNYAPMLEEQAARTSEYRSRYLKTLQRELANNIFRRDPMRFLDLYKKIHTESERIKRAGTDLLTAKQLLLSEKYPYGEFDLISVRDYVLYADAFQSHSAEEIEQRYSDILAFQALQSKLSDHWPRGTTTSDKELEHLTDYAQRFANTKLKWKLKKVISDYFKYSQNNMAGMDNIYFSVRPLLSSIPESRYGIHLKTSNEFGLYGVFAFDDGRIHESYYRSNESFENEESIDYPLDLEINEED